MAAPFEFSSAQAVETRGTSGNVPVNVAINVPTKKIRDDELLRGAGFLIAGIVVAMLVNRFTR